jgi:hypothetical protein
VSGVHPDLGPELRQLAQTLLERVDPAIRFGLATLLTGEGAGRCEQVWCPVCALVALANDEQHPMLTVIAEHSTALLDMVRALLDNETDATPPPPTDPTGAPEPEAPSEPGRYQPIPVSVEE